MIKTTSVVKLQNAFRNKRAINEFATEYAKKIIEERKRLIDEEKNKQRQKEVFKKYTELYQPKENLTLKAKIIRPIEPKLSVEADTRDRQRKVYQKYTNLYQPRSDLRYKPF